MSWGRAGENGGTGVLGRCDWVGLGGGGGGMRRRNGRRLGVEEELKTYDKSNTLKITQYWK